MDKLSLLAIFAHPDDESCSPGGTLAKYADRGVEVTLVCATRGEGGVCDDPACGDFSPISRDQVGMVRLEELGRLCEFAAWHSNWMMLRRRVERLAGGFWSPLAAWLPPAAWLWRIGCRVFPRPGRRWG